jgi:aminoglycoside phosphotransferase (APT) family kinase protein
VGEGHAAGSYPCSWSIYGWIDGQPYADDLVEDEVQAAKDLALFVLELRRIDPAGGPRGGREPLHELDDLTNLI